MTRSTVSYRVLPLIALIALVAVGGCGDSSKPETMTWNQEALPSGLGNSGLTSVAFSGNRGIACGLQQLSNDVLAPVVLGTDSSSGWARVLPSGIANDLGFLAAAFDANAKGVIAGWTGTTQGVAILDERSGNWRDIRVTTSGIPTDLAYGNGRFWCGGVDDGGLFLFSDEADVWVKDPNVFSTPQEKGVRDIAFGAGIFAAVGWDDADGTHFLLTNDGSTRPTGFSAWTPVENGPAGSYYAVHVTASGGILVGGERLVDNGAQQAYVAFLSVYSEGEWTEIVLPDPDSMQRVMRIHEAADGSRYLLCGDTNGQIWRFDGTGWSREGLWDNSTLFSITEASGGRLYVAGAANAGPSPILVRKN